MDEHFGIRELLTMKVTIGLAMKNKRLSHGKYRHEGEGPAATPSN